MHQPKEARLLHSPIIRQLALAVSLLIGVFFIGTIGYWLLGDGRWSLLDCAYMTAITLTTVGYGDVLGIDELPTVKIYTMALALGGMGVTLYALGSLTAMVVERHLTQFIEVRKMMTRINKLENHIIVCGGGTTGVHIMEELRSSNEAFVLVDDSDETLALLRAVDPDLLFIRGNAMDEAILRQAGVERAKGLAAALHEDSENMFLTVSAGYLNRDLKIVAKCVEHKNGNLFTRAGAAYVVSPYFIGGMRMASELIRPHVVSFLDKMLRSGNGNIRVNEMTAVQGGRIVGKRLEEIDTLKNFGLNVLAICKKDEENFMYNPPHETRIEAGMTLLVIGSSEQAAALEKAATG